MTEGSSFTSGTVGGPSENRPDSPEGVGHPPGPKGSEPAAPPSIRSSRHTARWIAGAVVVVLVVVSIVLATRPNNQATKVDSPLLGHPAPAVRGVSFSGQPVSLRSYRGRYVYVNFFASWCPPCQEEEPDLIAFNFQQGRLPHGAALVSVVYDDPNSAARQYVARWGATWPTVSDPGGQIANAYGVSAPPTTFLVNPAGTVVGVYSGPVTTRQLNTALAGARRSA